MTLYLESLDLDSILMPPFTASTILANSSTTHKGNNQAHPLGWLWDNMGKSQLQLRRAISQQSTTSESPSGHLLAEGPLADDRTP